MTAILAEPFDPDNEARWWLSASCYGLEEEELHPGGWRSATSLQRKMCQACPVRRECLVDALDSEIGETGDDRWGIRGGFTGPERVKLHITAPTCPGCGRTTAEIEEIGETRAKQHGTCRPCMRERLVLDSRLTAVPDHEETPDA